MLRSIPRRYYIDVHITIGLEVLCVTVQHIRVVDEEEEISSLRVVQTFHEHLLSHLRALTVLSQIHIVELEHRSISPLHIDTGGLILQSLETERIELPSLVTSLRSIDTAENLYLNFLPVWASVTSTFLVSLILPLLSWRAIFTIVARLVTVTLTM